MVERGGGNITGSFFLQLHFKGTETLLGNTKLKQAKNRLKGLEVLGDQRHPTLVTTHGSQNRGFKYKLYFKFKGKLNFLQIISMLKT